MILYERIKMEHDGEQIAFEREPRALILSEFISPWLHKHNYCRVCIYNPSYDYEIRKNYSQTVIRIYSIGRRAFMIFILWV